MLRTVSRPLALAASALLVVGLAACGDDDSDETDDASAGSTTSEPVSESSSDPTTESSAAPDAGGPVVTAVDFSLTDVTVAANAVVTFANDGSFPHTMTADDDAFDSGRVEAGSETTVGAPGEPGAYAFHCEIHPAMTATLTVAG